MILETIRRCGFFFEVFGLILPDYLECGFFPNSTDPEMCIGAREVNEAKMRASKPGKCFYLFLIPQYALYNF